MNSLNTNDRRASNRARVSHQTGARLLHLAMRQEATSEGAQKHSSLSQQTGARHLHFAMRKEATSHGAQKRSSVISEPTGVLHLTMRNSVSRHRVRRQPRFGRPVQLLAAALTCMQSCQSSKLSTSSTRDENISRLKTELAKHSAEAFMGKVIKECQEAADEPTETAEDDDNSSISHLLHRLSQVTSTTETEAEPTGDGWSVSFKEVRHKNWLDRQAEKQSYDNCIKELEKIRGMRQATRIERRPSMVARPGSTIFGDGPDELVGAGQEVHKMCTVLRNMFLKLKRITGGVEVYATIKKYCPNTQVREKIERNLFHKSRKRELKQILKEYGIYYTSKESDRTKKDRRRNTEPNRQLDMRFSLLIAKNIAEYLDQLLDVTTDPLYQSDEMKNEKHKFMEQYIVIMSMLNPIQDWLVKSHASVGKRLLDYCQERVKEKEVVRSMEHTKLGTWLRYKKSKATCRRDMGITGVKPFRRRLARLARCETVGSAGGL